MKLLLIDDSELIGKRINTVLSELNYIKVLGQATEEKQAIEMILELMPDIILLDINIPGSSGFDILTWLKNNKSKIKVVMLSNHSSEKYRDLAHTLGASHFLDKATEFEKLPQLLLEITEQQRN